MKRFVKWAALLVASVVGVAICTLVWLTRDHAATHPTLAQAKLAPLIPVRQFYADLDAEWSYRPSANGEYIAWRGTRFVEEVVFFGRPGEKPLGWAKDIRNFYWDDVSSHLMVVTESRLWKIDPENSEKENWEDVTPRGFSHWTLPNLVHPSQERWLIASRDRNPAFSDLYTSKQDGSDKQLLIENDGSTLNWLVSKSLEPQVRIRRAENLLDRTLERWDGGDWTQVLTVPLNTTFWVIEVSADGETAFAMSARGRDKSALVALDLLTGQETVMHAEEDEDVFDVVNFDPFDGEIDAILPKQGSSEVVPLTPKGQQLARLISQFGGRTEIDRLNWSGLGRFVTASLSPEGKSYIYVLMDLEKGTAQQINEFSFRRRSLDALVTTEEVTIEARDGLLLSALLVRPKGVDGPVPTIVEVHGGPAQHVEWQYDHFRQFLANRGYAVLAVNFRGSTGAGKLFQAEGFRKFGREMQDDLVDAANWAVAEGIADPEALAVKGGSYGGYASTLAVLRDENPFKAVIAEHAVLDVKYQMLNSPHAWGLNMELVRRYFGDPQIEDDAKIMEKYSPNNLVENLDVPVLLVAGKRDRVVGFEQTEAFVRKADEFGKDVDLLLFEKEGHGLHRWQSNVQHARRVEDFLHQHLGGRSGGWDWIELAAEHLD